MAKDNNKDKKEISFIAERRDLLEQLLQLKGLSKVILNQAAKSKKPVTPSMLKELCGVIKLTDVLLDKLETKARADKQMIQRTDTEGEYPFGGKNPDVSRSEDGSLSMNVNLPERT